MKALEILNALYNFASFRKKDIDEAIAELELLQKENEKLQKEVDYWKLSFNKQVKASRKKDGSL